MTALSRAGQADEHYRGASVELSVVTTALRRWWAAILLSTWAAAAAAGVLTGTQEPVYTATAQGIVSVGNPADRPPYVLSSGAQYILDRMTSYANLGVTTPVLAPVVDDLGLDETPESLSGHISSESVVGKAFVEVAVTYDDPRSAAAIADSVLAEMSDAVWELERGNVQLVPTGAAAPPTGPSNRKIVINAVVAGAGGLVLGCFVAVGLAAMPSRTRTRGAEGSRSARGQVDG